MDDSCTPFVIIGIWSGIITINTIIPKNTNAFKNKYTDGIWYFLLFVFLLWGTLYLLFPGFVWTMHCQYKQAVGLEPITNFEPALFVYTWKILMKIFGHYSSLMVINTVILWAGLVLTVSSLIRRKWLAAVLILALGLGPYYLPYVPHYYKDILFGAGMLLSFGLLLKARDQKTIWLIYLAIFFLFFAVFTRHNGFIAVFPVWLATAHFLKSKIDFFRTKTNVKGTSLFLFIFLFSNLATIYCAA